MRRFKWWLWLLLLIPLGLLVGFSLFVGLGTARNQPLPEAEAALVSDDQVTVETDDWLVFNPAGVEPTTGLIFYPGGLVPPAAYAPLARDIAAQGYLVVIPSMPLNLAVIAPGRAGDIIAAYPDIDTWFLGGHSLGGAMAVQYAYNHPGEITGLVLLGAYGREAASLHDQDIPVLSIYGTLDGVSTPADLEAAAPYLPPATRYIPIEGGNHTQFGYYGEGLQSGDNPATITRQEQQDLTLEAILDFIQEHE